MLCLIELILFNYLFLKRDFWYNEGMINEIHSKRYCSEDISIIENYHTAVADKEKKWEIHHRRECDDEGRTLLTHKLLIEMNLYYNRPAKELIFVTRSMHIKLHKKYMKNIEVCAGRKIQFLYFNSLKIEHS